MCLMFTPAAHPSTCVREAACHKACTSMCSILLVCVCVCIVMDESARAAASAQRGKQKALAALRLLLHPTKCKCAEKQEVGTGRRRGGNVQSRAGRQQTIRLTTTAASTVLPMRSLLHPHPKPPPAMCQPALPACRRPSRPACGANSQHSCSLLLSALWPAPSESLAYHMAY